MSLLLINIEDDCRPEISGKKIGKVAMLYSSFRVNLVVE